MGEFDGKVVFITGVARGQGRKHAIRFAREGAKIIGLDLCAAPSEYVKYPTATEEDLRTTIERVEAEGGEILAEVGDVRFAGFEGCVQYRHGAPLQYTQKEATRMARKLPAADVLLSHAPPAGVHEEPHDDRAHEGFEALREYIWRVQPRLALHGHTPPPPRRAERIGGTKVVHVVGVALVDVP